MRINGISPHSPSSAVKTKTSSPVNFNSRSQSPAPISTEKTSPLPISSAELKMLAEGIKNGSLDKNQASKLFVSTVITNSLKCKLGEQDREQLIKNIQDFLSDDDNFLAKISKNLNDLA